jgi:hypothetical protein
LDPYENPDTDDVHSTWRQKAEYKGPNLKEDKDYRHKACGGALIVNQTQQLRGKNRALIFKLQDAEGDCYEFA